jgi:hypothetical protein
MREREQGAGVGGRIDETNNDKEASVSGPTEVQSGSGRAMLRGAGCVRAKTASEGGRGAVRSENSARSL